MNLIPVIDLMQGQVVRGVRGDRQAYRPIVSRLCGNSDPPTVARILCDHCATLQLYVADLDALTGHPVQIDALRTLLHALPRLEAVAGRRASRAARRPTRCATNSSAGSQVVAVFGNESLASRAALAQCFGDASTWRPTISGDVLSLDRRDGQHLDIAGCWDAPTLWPRRVIVMTLERVGAGAGPDLETLAEVRSKSPSTFVVGAGGIRNPDDLAQARDAGAGAWLVASALHDGGLPRAGG